jgi:DMSO/TMAO reductase YedYZ molybdopterin-dependent catalytic subunit
MRLGRREFLSGAAAMALLAGCDRPSVHSLAKKVGKWGDNLDELLFPPARLAPELPISEQTPNQEFPSYFKSPALPIAPTNWTLKVGGLVERPVILTLNDLVSMPATEMRVRHYCVDGWTAVASWRGVRVSEIAKLAGIDPHAKFVEFRSFDAGYSSGWDLASALHPQTLLAYGMNGHPLGVDHGAPLRLYSAIKLGYKSVKYLSEVNFLPTRVNGYWEDRGFDWYAGV